METLLNEKHEEYTLLTTLHEKGVISPEDLQSFVFLEGRAKEMGVPLKTYQLLLGIFGDRPAFFSNLLGLKFQVVDQGAMSKSGDFKIPPDKEAQILQECKNQGIIEDSHINDAQTIQNAFNVMGISLSILEILTLNGNISAEKIAAFKSCKDDEVSQPANIAIRPYTLKSPDGGLSCPSLGKLAVLNKLITEETLSQILSIQERLKNEFQVSAPLERLLFEKGLIDRRHIFSLFHTLLRLSWKISMENALRCRLTKEGDRVFEDQCKTQNKIPGGKIKEAKKVVKALLDAGVQISLCEVLVAKGDITLKDLISLKLPPESGEPPPQPTTQKLDLTNILSTDEEILISSGIITKEQHDTCLALKQRFEEQYSFSLPVTRWLVAKGYANDFILNEIKIARDLSHVKEKLKYAYIRFNPDEEVMLMERFGARWHSLRKSSGFSNVQEKLQEMGLSWTFSDYLFMKGSLPREEIERILKLRTSSASQGFFRFPAWVNNETSKLAVANRYLSQEECIECLAIQRYCEEKLYIFLPFELILLKKGYLGIKELRALYLANYKNKLYSEWSRFYYLLCLSDDQDQQITEIIRKNRLVSEEVLSESEQIKEVFCLQIFKISLFQILLLRDHIPDWLASDLTAEHMDKFGWQRTPAAPQLPRPPSFRWEKAGILSSCETVEDHILKDKLLGQLAIQEGLLSHVEVDEGIFLQHHINEMGLHLRVGEVLTDLGYLSPLTVQELISLQSKRLQDVQWPSKGFLNDEDYVLCQTVLEYETTNPIDVKRSLYIQGQLEKLGLNVRLRSILQKAGILEDTILEGQISSFKDQVDKATATEEEIAAQQDKEASKIKEAPAPPAVKPSEKVVETPPKEARYIVDARFRRNGILLFLSPVLFLVLFFLITTFINTLNVRKEIHEEKIAQAKQKAAIVKTSQPKGVCPICQGKITVVQKCSVCGGTGSVPCLQGENICCKDGFIQVKVNGKWYPARKLVGKCKVCKGVWHNESCPGNFGDHVKCERCGGKGSVVCPKCGGTGTVSFPCPRCSK